LLNEAQRSAVASVHRDILVLAGAGSGKTKTLVARAERLIADGVEPSRILLLTFTKKAGGEMRHRMRSVLGSKADGVTIATFHAWAVSWIRRHPKAFGRDGFQIAKDDESRDLMDIARDTVVDGTKDALEAALSKRSRLVVTDEKGEHNVPDIEAQDRIRQLDDLPESGAIADLWSFFRNTAGVRERDFREYVLERRFVATDYQARILQDVVNKYQEEKLSQGYVDYDDMLTMFRIAVSTDDSSIRDEVRRSYDHILVDELQDTSPLQWGILEQVRDPAHLFTVGDDAQAIYGFRGADFRNVYDFKERLKDAQVLKLTDNYRSTQPILDLSNWLLEQSALKYDKKLVAARGNGTKPLLVFFSDPFDEAVFVADEIQAHRWRGGKLRDVMAIARSGFDLRLLEGELLKRQVPYVMIGGKSFLESKHIRDLLSLVLAANNHRDKLAWRRLLLLLEGIGRKTATLTADQLAACPNMDAAIASLASSKKEGLRQAANLVRLVRGPGKPKDVIQAARGALMPTLAAHYNDLPVRVKDFDILEDIAGRHLSLLGFLDAYALETVTKSQAIAREEDHVTLITAHSSKGTESPIVFILSSTKFPHSRAKTEEEVEEERRILYVAMTRAKDTLVLTASDDGDDRWFLADVPPGFLAT
jgi:DNA helicase-2/ATP-dependent DNA helicase PcrA